MVKKPSKAALKRDAAARADLFLAIGEFIFEFSQLEFTIRHLLGVVLEIDDGKRFNLIVSPYDFATLCRVVDGFLAQMDIFGADRLKDIHKLFKSCLRMNDERVRIAHGSWFLGAGARHVSRQTFKAEYHYDTPDKIRQKTAEVKRCMSGIIAILIGNREGEWPSMMKALADRK